MHPKSFVSRAPPRLDGRAYSAPPHPLPGFNGPILLREEMRGRVGKERGGRGEEGREGRRRQGRKGEGICRTIF